MLQLGSVECTDLLLKAGADVSIRESFQFIDILIKAGAD